VMNDLVVSLATPADADAVEALLDAAAEWQRARGWNQWTPGWFGDEVREAIAERSLYVARNAGDPVGSFMLDEGSERMIQWLSDTGRSSTSGISVGRLVVAREVSGQGLGFALLDAASKIAAEQGFTQLRLDCPAENERLCRYYSDAGFAHIGDNDIPGPNGEPWISRVSERSTSIRSAG